MNAHQILVHVVRPALLYIGLKGRAAEQLIMGTIWKESGGAEFIKQYPTGPALGIVQMEPATEKDIWKNYLKFNQVKRSKVLAMLPAYINSNEDERAKRLKTDLMYAVVMCRLHYFRVRAPLPKADDIQAMGEYWDKYYNCNPHKGTAAEFVSWFPKEVFKL
jgi:hypothetical protein